MKKKIKQFIYNYFDKKGTGQIDPNAVAVCCIIAFTLAIIIKANGYLVSSLALSFAYIEADHRTQLKAKKLIDKLTNGKINDKENKK